MGFGHQFVPSINMQPQNRGGRQLRLGPLLGWPHRNGFQSLNGNAARKCGLGEWVRRGKVESGTLLLPSPLEGEGAPLGADEGLLTLRLASTNPSSVSRKDPRSTFSLKGRRGGMASFAALLQIHPKSDTATP